MTTTIKKVAIVHDWLVTFGGAERIVQQLLIMYPQADIYTLVYDKEKMDKYFPAEKVHTSSIQKIPWATKIYTKLLKFMPKAFEEFDLSSYDLVISSSSSCAKGVITPPTVPYVAYIHTPMRYAWDLYFDYRKNSGKMTQFFMKKWIPAIRQWDYISSQRIDSIVANSNYIARRIKKFWNRESTVIYPPVETERLSPNGEKPEDFYIVFSRFVTYKRIDLAIKACGRLKRNLVVIGSGSQQKELEALAAKFSLNGAYITFTGRIGDDDVKDYLQRCRALIFCAEEDFGIIPVEAQACGRPVVAYGKGGALETVVNKKTGVFFNEQNVDSLIQAIEDFEALEKKNKFNSATISKHAQEFSSARFRKQFAEVVNETQNRIEESLSNTSDKVKNVKSKARKTK